MLTEREEEIFQSLLDSAPDTFKGKLYRDGVPRPDIYLAQQVRAVFVFREPNLRDDPYELDMRAQIRDPEFRAMRHGEYRKPATRRGWWNWKVGCLAHAVVGALAGRSPEQGFTQFDALIRKGQRAHEFLFPFGFMQIKKVGGSGESKGDEIETHARPDRLQEA